MKRYVPILVVVMMIATAILSACAAPAPQVVTVKETVVVAQEKIVQQTVVVPQEKVVQQTVVVEKVVAATPVPPTAVPQVPTEKQMGGTLNVWLPNGWPDKHWSYLTNWESTFAVSPMAEFLFWPKPDGTLEPMLGKSYDVSEDGLTYTVHLREGVKWHDGEPFTAEDVAYTYWMHANPNLKPLGWIYNGQTVKDYVNFNQGKADDITGIKVIDPLTLQITLDSPDASLPRTFLTYGQIPILPKHILEKMPEDVRFNTSNPDPYWTTNPVGTGPYKFVQYVEDQYIEYARNDDYWGGKVGPEKLFMKISDPNVAMIALEKGELDYMYPTQLTEVKRLQANPNLELVEAKNQGAVLRLDPQLHDHERRLARSQGQTGPPEVGRPPGLRQHDPAGLWRGAQQPDGRHGLRLPDHDRLELRPGRGGQAVDRGRLAQGEARRVDHGLHVLDRATSLVWTTCRSCRRPSARWASRPTSTSSTTPSINDYLSGNGPRGKDYDTQVLLWGPGEDPQKLCNVSDLNNKTNAGVWGCPDSWSTTIPFDTYMKTCWKYDNKRVQEICSLTAKETDPAKRIKLFQEMDCILNEEIPYFTTAAPSFVLSKSKRLQGVDWTDRRRLGWWMALYKPGDFWLWQQ